MTVDPADLQVLLSRLQGIAEEMGAVLRRSAFSPNIKERADCSAAVFTAGGELLAQAEHIPVHLGSMPASVEAAVDAHGSHVRPGDQIALNDPFYGGTHLNDLTLVAPCYDGGTLIGWVANRAHHADVGGMVPGSIPPEATEIQQEGFRIPPVMWSSDIEALVMANSRTPDERRGDLDAQLGANVLGAQRLAEVATAAPAPLDRAVAYGERRARAALSEVPDGSWEFADVLDSCGPRDDQQHEARIRLRLTVAGDTVAFDFTGTDEQRPGNVNAVRAVTVSAVSFALRSALDPTLPANGGVMRAVDVVAPAGTVVAATPPVAVGAGNVEVSQRVADVCFGALAQAVPDRVAAAGQGTMNNVLLGGEGWVFYETIAGGQGGRPGGEGMSGVHTGMTNSGQVDYRKAQPGQSGIHTGMTNTQNTPIEAIERAIPVRVRVYKLRSGSGGVGAGPGGEGIWRELEFLEPTTVSLICERQKSRPWGLHGGEPGVPGENWLLPGGDEREARRLPDKCTVHADPGDVLRMLTPGGGGWGPPPVVRAMS